MKKFLLIFFLYSIFVKTIECTYEYYDAYEGIPLTRAQFEKYRKANLLQVCAVKVKECDPDDWRRVDGTCNNLRNISRGAAYTPLIKVLPSDFVNVREPRLSENDDELPLARELRTNLLKTEQESDDVFTTLLTHFYVLTTVDVTSLADTFNYVFHNTQCCCPEGKDNDECIPNKVPANDPINKCGCHMYTCINQTRPKSFQSIGCLKKGTEPERVVTVTPLFDLSPIYGLDRITLTQKNRLYKKGLLKYEIENGKMWPPNFEKGKGTCVQNRRPKETRCHDTPNNFANTIVGLNLYIIWFWRHHNRLALELARINPSWNDEKLFQTARDINIACYLQIFYYEFLPCLFGKDNLVKDGVICEDEGFRDIYNGKIDPQLSVEYTYIMRWVHSIQEGMLKMYDKDGNYEKQIEIVKIILRTGYVVNNIESITRGSLIQPCAKIGCRSVNPELADHAYGPLQKLNDVFTNDLSKGRYYGLPSYTKYRERFTHPSKCGCSKYKTFEDLSDVMEDESINLLKDSYDDVRDVDLMAGLWLENPIDGGYVPTTFYKIAIDQLIRNVKSDRHWYERSKRPNAFTPEQLKEIRKITMSRILCDVGDCVDEIQPNAFMLPTKELNNEVLKCKDIPQIDLRAWECPCCSCNEAPSCKKEVPGCENKQPICKKKEDSCGKEEAGKPLLDLDVEVSLGL